MKRIAFIIGHSLASPGAVSYLGESERFFNSKIADRLSGYFNDDVFRWYVKEDHYVQLVKDFNPDLIIELHFNAYHVKAYGCEAITFFNDSRAEYEANELLKLFSERFNIRNRGTKIVQFKYQRGFKNFYELREFPMVIFEPCFGNFKTKDSEKIIGNPHTYAEFLVEYINFKLGLTDKVNKTFLDKLIDQVRSWFL